jgi:hypothetical protein
MQQIAVSIDLQDQLNMFRAILQNRPYQFNPHTPPTQ